MSSLIQFRLDSKDKEVLESMLKSMGLDLGTAFRIFAAKVIQTGSIPFSLKSDIDPSTIMSAQNLKAYKEAKKELERGEAISLEELKAKYCQ